MYTVTVQRLSILASKIQFGIETKPELKKKTLTSKHFYL